MNSTRGNFTTLTDLGATSASARGADFRSFILNNRGEWQRLAKEANLSGK